MPSQDTEQQPENSAKKISEGHFPVVGVGASAGGLEAFQKFLTEMPTDLGMAFVLIPHLDPTHKSLLVDLLKKYTSMPVHQAEDNVCVEPNSIYVIPPNKHLAMDGMKLVLSTPVEPRGFRMPIDYFFTSLAANVKDKAIAVVLSGTGSDGTRGLRAIKEHGGLVVVQEEASAKFDGMPRSAINTGLVDYVLPAEEIGRTLVHALLNKRVFLPRMLPPGLSGEDELVSEILSLVHASTQHDFSAYKKPTVLRRIERRMNATKCARIEDYLAYMKRNSEEAALLFEDILIGVTSFFRDPEAFETFATKVVRPLIRRELNGAAPIRVWVPGCATGEEAYTLAMLFLEQMEELQLSARVQIFATDIDIAALEHARTGVYSAAIEKQVSQQRLSKFFVRDEKGFKINKTVREMVLFAQHDLVSDPPFSRIDVISCRNLFIYFDAELQRKIMSIFYYALNANAFLFMGTAESIGDYASEYFSVVDKKCKVFQRRMANVRPHFDSFVEKRRASNGKQPALRVSAAKTQEDSLNALMERKLVERFLPSAVILNDRMEVLQFSGKVTDFLELSPGEATHNIMKLAKPSIQVELRAIIHNSARERDKTLVQRVRVMDGNLSHTIVLTATPLAQEGPHSELTLVTFEKLDEQQQGRMREVAAEDYEPISKQLEAELKATKEHLRTVVDEHDLFTQDLKAANEELLSMNEELQSTTEELETSKEELQSMNEELETVNAELQAKVEELSRLNNDLNNVFTSSEIAQIFLDSHLGIRRFTPTASKIFNLIGSDIGRPLLHISSNLEHPNLLRDLESVLSNLIAVERQVRSKTGEWYTMRVLPYKTVENLIDGVVLTFAEVTKLLLVEQELQVTEMRNRALITAIPDTLFRISLDGRLLDYREGRVQLLDISMKDFVGRRLAELPAERLGAAKEVIDAIVSGSKQVIESRLVEEHEFHLPSRISNKKVEYRDYDLRMVACGTDEALAIMRDITEKKRSEEALRLATDAERASRAKSAFLARISHELRTPLNAILGFTELLKLECDGVLDEKQQAYIEDIESSGHILLDHVNNLLDLSKAEAGKMELNISRFILVEVLRNIENMFSALVRQKHQTFAIRVEDSAPKELQLDKEKFVQILINLISNAIKFTGEGGIVSLNVSSTIVRNMRMLCIKVRDTGIGIRPEDAAQVFEPFRQVRSDAMRLEKGTGLGLALVKSLVDLQAGTVDVESTGIAGEGSTFTVCLPSELESAGG